MRSWASSKTRVLCAISGGPDSVALAHLLKSAPQSLVLGHVDHQMRAINLLTRLNWESRVTSSRGEANSVAGRLRPLVNELADYLLFAGGKAIATRRDQT